MRKSFVTMILLVMVIFLLMPLRSSSAKPPLNLAVTRQQFRNEYIRFEALIDSLAVKPGMSILDIGAGPGYASFLFAEKLQGSGRIFATDIRSDFVQYINEEAKRRGYANLSATVVAEKGLDDFYGRNRYDLVLLSNVYHCLDDRTGYFSRLRAFLNPGARLVLVLYNEAPLFTTDDLTDMAGLVRTLSVDEQNPFFRTLSPGTRELLKQGTGGDALEAALVRDFNAMLTDPRFYRHFYSNFYFKKEFLEPSERDFANWLLMILQEDGALDRDAAKLEGNALRTVIRLNRLFFIKGIGKHLRNEGRGAYIPAGDANRHTSKFVMLRELREAGYQFSGEIPLSPYFNAVILVPKER